MNKESAMTNKEKLKRVGAIQRVAGLVLVFSVVGLGYCVLQQNVLIGMMALTSTVLWLLVGMTMDRIARLLQHIMFQEEAERHTAECDRVMVTVLVKAAVDGSLTEFLAGVAAAEDQLEFAENWIRNYILENMVVDLEEEG